MPLGWPGEGLTISEPHWSGVPQGHGEFVYGAHRAGEMFSGQYDKGFRSVFSTTIGRGLERGSALIGRKDHSELVMLTPAILCNKEPARASKDSMEL